MSERQRTRASETERSHFTLYDLISEVMLLTCVYHILSVEAVGGLPSFKGRGNRPHALMVSSKFGKSMWNLKYCNGHFWKMQWVIDCICLN